MRRKISRYLVVVLLCFSCILLFKSIHTGTDVNGMEWEKEPAEGTRYRDAKKDEPECGCGYSPGSIRFYLDGRRYITLDVMFLTAAMVLIFVLVLERG